MVKIYQHLAGAGGQEKLKMLSFCLWLIFSGLTEEIICADTTNEKQSEAHTSSTLSSINDVSQAQPFTEESFLDSYDDHIFYHDDLSRFSRSIPSIKTASEATTESKLKDGWKHDYIFKIPLSLLRQHELYRLLLWQDQENNENFEKRQTVIPVPRVGRSNHNNEYDNQDTGSRLFSINSDEDNSNESYLDDLFKEDSQNIFPIGRNSRSMLLLTSPKSEEANKEKPAQTFVLPYPRPGRSNKYAKVEKSKNEHLILPYPRPGRSEVQDQLPQKFALNNEIKKYILSTSRLERTSLDPQFIKEKDSMVIDDWPSVVKSNTFLGKLNKENLSDKITDGNEGNSFFVIPYPRPGKKAIFKLKNTNHKSKNSEKEMTDYVVPYPRPGKKSGKETSGEFISSKSKEIGNSNLKNMVFPFHQHGKSPGNSLITGDSLDFPDALNNNQNIDSNIIQYENNEMIPFVRTDGLFVTPNKKFESEFNLPYLRTDRNFDNVVPYPRPGRFASPKNDVTHLFSYEIDGDFEDIEASKENIDNSEDLMSGIYRFKRSYSVVPYPRFGRSNVVPYPRPGRSNVVPYPRPGRSNVLPYPRPGRPNSDVLYSRLGKSNSVVPYPRLGKSISIVPYPRTGRSDAVVPYPRLGRSTSVISPPRSERSKRSSSILPYPRSLSSDSVVPYPRPGRAESLVPYPRPGRAEFTIPYPRPGRAESIVPYPRPGRSDSVVPYPRPGRSEISKSGSPNKNGKPELWLLPNIRPGRSNEKQNSVRNKRIATRPKRSLYEEDSELNDLKNKILDDSNSVTLYSRAANGQGYVLPHPRIGRMIFQERKKKDSFDTDTVIPYPRLGRSQEEAIPVKYSPERQNSIHKLNKHVLSNVQDSVYLLPYPRPGRNLNYVF